MAGSPREHLSLGPNPEEAPDRPPVEIQLSRRACRHRRSKTGASSTPRKSQRNGSSSRCRTYRPRRKPLYRYKIQRSLRDTRRDNPDASAPGCRITHSRQRSSTPQTINGGCNAELTYKRILFAPETQLLQNFIKESQVAVTGTAKTQNVQRATDGGGTQIRAVSLQRKNDKL